jgi:putative serine protease PepD
MNNQSDKSPWWIPAEHNQQPLGSGFNPINLDEIRGKSSSRFGEVSFVLALILAIMAGLIGGIVGEMMGSKSRSVSFLTSHTVVERSPDSVAGVAARISPSVVSIQVQSDAGSDEGSGFFISNDGYILTNNHVIDTAATNGGSISVVLSTGRTYVAKIIGRDTAYDLAVLKINVTDAPAMHLGNSDLVAVGDPVIAVGSPLGLSGTVTLGIISAKNRAVTAGGNGAVESSYINALQTDAAINPGNSGGPLVNMAGDVIGVNSAIASLGANSPFSSGQAGSIGLGFAIPINQAKKTANQLIKTGHSSYPIMGIALDSSFTQGAKVAEGSSGVRAGGPAARAGIRPGDIILKIDNVMVANSQEAIIAVRSHNIGDQITVLISRGGKKLTFTLRLASSG